TMLISGVTVMKNRKSMTKQTDHRDPQHLVRHQVRWKRVAEEIGFIVSAITTIIGKMDAIPLQSAIKKSEKKPSPKKSIFRYWKNKTKSSENRYLSALIGCCCRRILYKLSIC